MTVPRRRRSRPRAPIEPGWIGLRIQGPVDVMERLQHALGRDLHLNDDRGAKPRDEVRDGRLYFWIKPTDAQIEALADLLTEARPEGDTAPVPEQRERRR